MFFFPFGVLAGPFEILRTEPGSQSLPNFGLVLFLFCLKMCYLEKSNECQLIAVDSTIDLLQTVRKAAWLWRTHHSKMEALLCHPDSLHLVMPWFLLHFWKLMLSDTESQWGTMHPLSLSASATLLPILLDDPLFWTCHAPLLMALFVSCGVGYDVL